MRKFAKIIWLRQGEWLVLEKLMASNYCVQKDDDKKCV